LERPGMPRAEGLDEICRLHAAYGRSTTRDDIQRGRVPGHLFDEAPQANRGNVARLLTAMMLGYLEGRLVTKSGDFVAVVGCGVIEFACRSKPIGGRLRGLLKGLGIATNGIGGTRGRRTKS
jgi:hypothetical protein